MQLWQEVQVTRAWSNCAWHVPSFQHNIEVRHGGSVLMILEICIPNFTRVLSFYSTHELTCLLGPEGHAQRVRMVSAADLKGICSVLGWHVAEGTRSVSGGIPSVFRCIHGSLQCISGIFSEYFHSNVFLWILAACFGVIQNKVLGLAPGKGNRFQL